MGGAGPATPSRPRASRPRPRPTGRHMPRPTNPSELSLPDSFALACRMSGPLELRAVHRATRAEQTHTLTHPFALIGRAPSAGVRLDDPSVSQCHAYLQVVEGLPYCIDLGSRTGVVWDDGTQSRGWVRPGHVLRVGAFDVRVGRPGSADDPHAAAADEPIDRDGHHALVPAALEVHAPGAAAASHPLDRPIR